MSEEVIHESWFSRIGGAFKGIVTGVVIFLAAFPLLWWNEGRAVRTAQALTEGAAAVQETQSDRIDPADDGKFVHLTGEATTDDILEDPELGVAVNALRLERTVEMYQWEQEVDTTTRKKLGGGTETVKKYSYRKTWSDRAINSEDFRDPGHDNPGAFPFEGFAKTARDVRVGEYQLPDSLIENIRQSEPLSVSLEDVPADWRGAFRLHGSNGFYLPVNREPGQARSGDDSTAASSESQQSSGQHAVQAHGLGQPGEGTPQIGDVRITYTATRPTAVSIMSQQTGNTFTPFTTSNGQSLNMLAMGNVPAGEMISRAEAQNAAWTWGLRAAGFIMMGIGLGLLFKPFSVFADVIPIAGDIVEAGTGMISFFIAGACALGTISVAWLFYRPLIGVPLLVAGIGLFSALVFLLRKARSSRAAASSDQPAVAERDGSDENVAAEDVNEAISL